MDPVDAPSRHQAAIAAGAIQFSKSCSVIARSEATKQSILPYAAMDCFASLAMTGPNSSVVPANAGTHNHRRLWLRKVSTNVPNTNGTAYGSRRSPGRRKMMQIVKQQTRIRDLAAQCARAVEKSSAQRGRGECRMPVAPAASCALGSGRTHTSNNEYTGITRHSRTQWF
jgi:hypothetical protein